MIFVFISFINCFSCLVAAHFDEENEFDMFVSIVDQLLTIFPDSGRQLLSPKRSKWLVRISKPETDSQFEITKKALKSKKKKTESRNLLFLCPFVFTNPKISESVEELENDFTIENLKEIDLFQPGLYDCKSLIELVFKTFKDEFSNFFPSDLFMKVTANGRSKSGKEVIRVKSSQGMLLLSFHFYYWAIQKNLFHS